VIVLDANLLLHAFDSKALRHDAARAWLETALSGSEFVGLPWQTIYAFLRISTDPRISADQFPMERAIGVVQRLLNHPTVRILTPGERHWSLLQRMLVEGQAKGPLATDAQLAALTIESGGVLYTNDRDFARFPGLRWVNPLVES
jgi:toxin-antitoxin system PIN domain toxin